MNHDIDYKNEKKCEKSNGLPCSQVLLSYFSNGDIASDEIRSGDRFIRQSNLAQHILNREFSEEELLTVLSAVSCILNKAH